MRMKCPRISNSS